MSNSRRKSDSRKIRPRATFVGMPSPLGLNFAQELLELETQVDFSCTMENIHKLLELYTQAIEYYESVQDPKYIHYHDRMQNFLIRKDVLKLINAPTSTQPEPSRSEVISAETIKKKKEEAAVKQRVRSRQFSKTIEGTVSEKRHAENIINTHINDAQAIKSKLQENLKSQGDLLNQRLMQRKAARQRGSSCDISTIRPRVMSVYNQTGQTSINSSPTNSFNEESDRSGGPSIRSSLVQFEDELEKLMEKFVEDKMLLTRAIKNKCKKSIEEVREMGQGGNLYTEIVNQIINEIEKSMNEELTQTIKELEAKRKEETAKLRKRICY